MAKRKRKNAGDSQKLKVYRWRLSPLGEMLEKYIEKAKELKGAAEETDDVEFVKRAEGILSVMNHARVTLRLCPQNQFRDIELKAKEAKKKKR